MKKLQKTWIARIVPIYSERDIREMNLEYMGDILQHWGDQSVRGFGTQCNKDSKSWILKQSYKWLGWNPSENQYFDQPILFGGDIDFKTNFESLVISDGQSKSVNLIWTVKNFIKKGEEMGLTNDDWVQVFLLLTQKYFHLIIVKAQQWCRQPFLGVGFKHQYR